MHASWEEQYLSVLSGQRQLPLEQISVGAQRRSHAPQWSVLERVSTQALTDAQYVWPVRGQRHCALWHT
jgi:hypothetical protein